MAGDQSRCCAAALTPCDGVVEPPSTSSRPSTAITSKIPGDAVAPVSAARSGCASWPSFDAGRFGLRAHRLLERGLVPAPHSP